MADGVGEGEGHGRSGFRSGPSLLCPELVGRAEEVAVLRGRVEAAAQRRGGVVVLVGEAGTGKSRLVDEVSAAGRECDAAVLFGRAVPGANPVPYRPLTEALLAAFRAASPPDAPELAGFAGHLGRIVPAWRVGTVSGSDESPVLVSEAAVRLLALLGRGRGCVLVLEDLHWADPETIGTVDYFADALWSNGSVGVIPGRRCGCRPFRRPVSTGWSRHRSLVSSSVCTVRATRSSWRSCSLALWPRGSCRSSTVGG